MSHGLPPVGRGQTVGLLGGSFDPAHEGHVHITTTALERLGLDWVWWLVSPGNPLKARGPAPLPQRMARAREVMDHPQVRITDAEARLGTRYTADTIRRLRALSPGTRFVWIMGSDNLAQFHRWRDWREIAATVPLCIVARPGQRLAARFAPVARSLRARQLNEGDARLLPWADPPAWVVLNLPLSGASSTAIRARGGWR